MASTGAGKKCFAAKMITTFSGTARKKENNCQNEIRLKKQFNPKQSIKHNYPWKTKGHYLNETNFLGVAAEALSATHEPILANQPMGIPAHTTAKQKKHNTKIRINNFITFSK